MAIRLVMIDDEKDLLFINTELFHMLGYVVHSFYCPQQGLTWMLENIDAFDVVLTDQSMPGLSGNELIQRVWVERQVPALLISGYSSNTYLNNAEDPMLLTVEKPISVRRLDELIRSSWPSLESEASPHAQGGDVELKRVGLVTAKAEKSNI
tara:strand:- start:154 stop:609 length:456 start_codon:yes stop_codon:yes gene_type:complete